MFRRRIPTPLVRDISGPVLYQCVVGRPCLLVERFLQGVWFVASW